MLLRRKNIILLILIAHCLFLQGCGNGGQMRETSLNTDEGLIKTETVKRKDISYTANFAGRLIPAKLTNLGFEDVSGDLISIDVNAGDHVKAGGKIAELNKDNYYRELSRLEMEDNIWRIKKDIQTQNLALLDNNITLSELTVENAKAAIAKNGGSMTGDLKYQLNRAEIQLESARLTKEIADANKDISNIEYANFLKDFEEYRKTEEKYVLKAVSDGVITYVDKIEPGKSVSSGRNIVKMVKNENMVIAVNIDDALYLKNQNELQIIIDGTAYEAYIYEPQPEDDIWINPLAESDALNNSIYIALKNNISYADLYRTVAITVVVNKKDALVIDKKCIKQANGLSVVDLLTEGRYYSAPVICGIDNAAYVEIISGLNEGDIVSAE